MASIESQFAELADRWERETAHLSSFRQISNHPCFLGLIDLGDAVIPLAIERFQAAGFLWAGLLTTITGLHPGDATCAGLLDKQRAAWLAWGRERYPELAAE